MNSENAVISLTQQIKNTLVNLIGDDEEVINMLIHTYTDDMQKLMQSLRKAILNRDLRTIILITHTIKSSSSNLGVNQLTKLATMLEKLARSGDIDTILLQSAQLEIEYERVCFALQEFVD